MSRHEGVSCDACMHSNFRGRRYKCLICYDYDLCANCYEAASTTTHHTADHPMQCILTRSDFELFYGGEALSIDQPQSFTCPHCGKMGFTEVTLADHVQAQHSDTTTQVVCPVCASVPNGEPNHVTEDLSAHLSMDHRAGGGGGSRDLISFGDEPSGSRHASRRVPHPSRGVSGPRIRRFNMHFRESMDPITELLSQLSGVRRAATSASSAASSANPSSSSSASSTTTANQLQQLQMHLQLERQQYAQVVRQHTERLPRRQNAQPMVPGSSAGGAGGGGGPAAAGAPGTGAAAATANGTGGGSGGGAASAQETSGAQPSSDGHQFLLAGISDEADIDDPIQHRQDSLDRCQFVQEIVTSMLSKSFEETLVTLEAGDSVSASEKEAVSCAKDGPETSAGVDCTASAEDGQRPGQSGGIAAGATPRTTSSPYTAAAAAAAAPAGQQAAAAAAAAAPAGQQGAAAAAAPAGQQATAAAAAPTGQQATAAAAAAAPAGQRGAAAAAAPAGQRGAAAAAAPAGQQGAAAAAAPTGQQATAAAAAPAGQQAAAAAAAAPAGQKMAAAAAAVAAPAGQQGAVAAAAAVPRSVTSNNTTGRGLVGRGARAGQPRASGPQSVGPVGPGARMVSVRGRRKPVRPPAAAAAVETRNLPAAEPPPPH